MSNEHLTGEGITCLIYGVGGGGKSLSAIRALHPDATFFLGLEQGAFTPALNPDLNHWRDTKGKLWLPPPKNVAYCLAPDRPGEEVRAMVDQKILPRVKSGEIGAVCADTISGFCTRCYDRHRGFRERDPYGNYAEMASSELRWLVSRIMAAGCIFVAIAHERKFTNFDGEVSKGGPNVPGKNLDLITAMFDIVLRAGWDTVSGVRQQVFWCDYGSDTYRMRDRWGVCRTVEPMDLRAILARARARQLGQPLPPPAEFKAAPAAATGAAQGAANSGVF